MNKREIAEWLHQEDENRLEELWNNADTVRRQNVGDAVHLRGLIEISSYCVRQCGYCGLRAGRKTLQRYRMNKQEIMQSVNDAVAFGYGTVVMQAGQDYGIETSWLAEIIGEIKKNTPLAITLSMGERSIEDFRIWKQAGANRYLLRFETSDRQLYEKIHPPLPSQELNRYDLLSALRELDYEVGSGVMIGIPGQTFETLVNDIITFKQLDLDMIGVGPFIAHPDTPLGKEENESRTKTAEQVPNSELMVYKVMALTRILCPEANIPSTTALATINMASGRELGLSRGANVVMPNLTPVKYRKLYEIYPAKACISETAEDCRNCLKRRIESIGRYIGTGPGKRVKTSPQKA
jgi:biotin synthase